MPRRVEFDWVDSGGHDGPWDSFDRVVDVVNRDGPLMCHTVAYLIHETPDTVTVAQSLTFDRDRISLVGQPLTIPRVAITSPIRDLRR